MAKTLGQVMRGVAKSNGAPFVANEELQMYTLTISYDDDRSQAVTAHLQTDTHGENWIIVSSTFGEVADLDPVDLLKRNESFAGLAYVGVESDGSAVVLTRMPLDNADEDLVARMVAATAAYADVLEEEFYGTDDK